MKSESITLYSDRQTKLPLTIPQQTDILSFKEFLGPQNVILQADNTLMIRNYVGFIAKNRTKLQILPTILQQIRKERRNVQLYFSYVYCHTRDSLRKKISPTHYPFQLIKMICWKFLSRYLLLISFSCFKETSTDFMKWKKIIVNLSKVKFYSQNRSAEIHIESIYIIFNLTNSP